jgi:hypothetical protein
MATRITAEVRVIVGIATTLAQTIAAIKARMFIIPIFLLHLVPKNHKRCPSHLSNLISEIH